MFENIIYKDLDMSLIQHPVSGDIIPITNGAAVKRSIRHLLSLEKYDIPFDSSTFSIIRGLLFEPASLVIESNMKSLIKWIIDTFEPRAELKRVDITTNPREDGYSIDIFFKILSLNTDEQMNIFLKRIR
jgi:phage baseplate assembly protein W